MLTIVVSVISMTVGAIAILLSWGFFFKTNDALQKMRDTENSISANLERINSLFNLFYTDTFSMVKDITADMRKNLWSDTDQGDKEKNEKYEILRNEVNKEMSKILKQSEKTDIQLKELSDIVGRAIDETREVERESKGESEKIFIKSVIVENLKKYESLDIGVIVAWNIFRGASRGFIVEAIKDLHTQGKIEISGSIENIYTNIWLKKPEA